MKSQTYTLEIVLIFVTPPGVTPEPWTVQGSCGMYRKEGRKALLEDGAP